MNEKIKPNIILDLDQTLISAEASEKFDFKKYKKKMELFNYKDMDGYYLVFERPHLQKFLDKLFKEFNVSVWTAATKDYALFIINKFILTKPERKLEWIFFSYHCKLSRKLTDNTKSLKILWEEYGLPNYNKNNTVILDDYDEVFNTQKNNCIIAIPFEFTKSSSEHDDFLEKLTDKLEMLKKNMLNESGNPADVINK